MLTYHDAAGKRNFKTDDIALETGAGKHWWTNDGSETVVLRAIDVYNKEMDPKAM